MGIYKSVNMDAVGGSGSVPYSSTFTTGSWAIDGSIYELTIDATTHGRGVSPAVQVFELVGSDYKQVETDITVAANGDVTLTITSTPDLRFNGRAVISGE